MRNIIDKIRTSAVLKFQIDFSQENMTRLESEIPQLGCGLFHSHPEEAGFCSIHLHRIQYEVHGHGPIKVVLIMGTELI